MRGIVFRILLSYIVLGGLSGCIAHTKYRSIYLECQVQSVAHAASCDRHAIQSHTSQGGANYMMGFIEFDDQGHLWDRAQMEAVLGKVEEASGSQELLMVVFVHGWKHSAAPGDSNVETFRATLARLSESDAQLRTEAHLPPRRVVGIYLGWRGGSVSVPLAKELTFWARREAAQRVGHGGVTEVLSRLELVKQTKNLWDTNTRLVLVGHSFGGAVVQAAVGQLLADRFVHTAGPPGVQSTVIGYGDLVVLINPAFEAGLFSSLSDLSAARGSYFPTQLPVVAVLTSEADWATRAAFPVGRWLSSWTERDHSMRRFNHTADRLERISGSAAKITAVGHFAPYRTHRLYPSDNQTRAAVRAAPPEQVARSVRKASSDWLSDEPGSKITFGPVTLERTTNSAGRNPYMVAYVDKQLIHDHNDIDDPRIIQFIEQLILISTQSPKQVEQSRRSSNVAAAADAHTE